MKQKAIICDLDGTLAIVGDRSPYNSKDCHLDYINFPVYDVVDRYYDSGVKVFLFSGRDGTYEKETRVWLEKHMVPYDRLIMRQPEDKRKDAIVKEEMFRWHIDGKYDVLFVLDDRDQVVKMWREIGLTCFQVNYGNF